MPELPEVETIARLLRLGGPASSSLIGRTIQEVHILWEGSIATPSPAEFRARLNGQEIRDVGRRGKFLIVQLSQDTLLFHLRMSGDLLVEPVGATMQPHHRLVLNLDGGLRLAFNDTRKFGRAWLVRDRDQVLRGLGPEPLDTGLTPQVFHQRLLAHRRQLKPLLMDQSFLAGLGNIYADEALYLARLHPLTLSHKLSTHQAERLLHGIRQVLQEGIHHSGSSIDWAYRGGNFQNYFKVYQRAGQTCLTCQTKIVRIVVGQRSTHYCPTCQPVGPEG